MFELEQVGAATWYMQAPTNVGFYRYSENEVCLIDIADRESAEQALAHIRKNNWRLTCVYLTHSHADHVGGAAHLCSQTGCRVFAPGISAAAVKYNFLVPSTLYGGNPCPEMHGTLLKPPACECSELTEDSLVPGLEYIRLDGHDMAQAVFRTKDGVWFTADTVISSEALEKRRISFIYNIRQHLESLDKLEALDGYLFIPSHGQPQENIQPLVSVNRSAVFDVAEDIRRMCDAPRTIDELISLALDKYNIRLYLMQYLIVGQTVRSYVSYLLEGGKIVPVYDKTSLYFRNTDNQ